MPTLLRLLVAVFGLTLVKPVLAVPTQLGEAEFAAQTSGLPTIVETFEGFPLGSQDSPLVIANGTYAGSPFIIGNDLWCPLSQCMNSDIQDGTFNEFPAGTTFWSTEILPASTGDIVRVTVTGNSGVLQIDLPLNTEVFVGFSDPTGLNSVAFHLIEGFVNYAFDDVTTAVAPDDLIFSDGFEDVP